MSPLPKDTSEAIALYAVAARDVVDFIDMVNDSETSMETLELLVQMLGHPGGPHTDVKLNALVLPVVEAQIKKRKADRW